MGNENKKDDQTAAREASLSAPAGSAGVETHISFWIEERTTLRNRINWLRKAFTWARKVKTYHPEFRVSSPNDKEWHEGRKEPHADTNNEQ
jgi:hypothetical protein